MTPTFSDESGTNNDTVSISPSGQPDVELTPPSANTGTTANSAGAPDNAAGWDEISDWYQSTFQISTDSPHYGPLCPDETELRLCGEVGGKRILELGCGGGQSAIAFARQGAHVIGIDISEEQIRHARRLAEQEEVKVEFKVGDLADLAFVQASSIDLVFSSYAFQYVERFDRLCRSVERVLSHRGLFVFSHDHPFWDCVDRSSGALTRQYFDESPEDWRWNDDPALPRMRSYHRTVSDIVTSLTRAGLELEMLLEPEPISDPASPWARSYPIELMRSVPATLVVRARKIA